jgi:multicomponent Na+:H+ antiporter subunit G
MSSSLMPWLASLLVLSGALISLLGAIGVLRLPDSYSRMHAASKTGVLGAVLILAGVAVASNAEVAIEVMLGVLVLLASAPLAAHALARAAYQAGIKPQLGPLGDALERERRKEQP